MLLLDALEDAFHREDVLFQIAHDHPNFRVEYDRWENDSLRIELTLDRVVAMREVFEAVLLGADSEDVVEILAKQKKSVH